jgi:uncharacterized protein YycO
MERYLESKNGEELESLIEKLEEITDVKVLRALYQEYKGKGAEFERLITEKGLSLTKNENT